MNNLTWSLQLISISKLKKLKKNPRFLTEKDKMHLEISLEKFGLIDKPIINLDMTLIGGHQRVNILKSQKIQMVECWIPNRLLDKKESEELNIRLNKNSGNFDFEILANEWDLPDLVEYGFMPDEFEIKIDLDGEKTVSPQEDCEENKCETCGQKIKKKKNGKNLWQQVE